MLQKIDLPYQDGIHYFKAVYHCHAPVILDSCHLDRYDIVSAEPRLIVKQTQDTAIKIDRFNDSNEKLEENIDDYLNKTFITDHDLLKEHPFLYGWIGFFGYDYARKRNAIPCFIKKDTEIPEAWFAYYDWSILCDHHEKKSVLFYDDTYVDSSLFHRFYQSLEEKQTFLSFELQSDFKQSLSKKAYTEKFKKIQASILDGDIYQINLSQRFHASYSGDPLDAYLRLRRKNPAPFSAMMRLDSPHCIASCSPERFISINQNQVITQPIKGTITRHPDPKQDQIQRQRLKCSEKDRAENLMIVDLLRNDLSQHCQSVKVPNLFELHTLENVHHLVSTITGVLKKGISPLKLLIDAFPGGSVTGAPKLRAMQITETIETTRRDLFCGSILYLSANQRLDSNIVIRTAVFEKNQIYLWAGSGVVYDSTPELEYQEILDKIGNIMNILAENEFAHC